MSEKKTIQINPDLFKISNKSNTRKKNTDKPPKIELKSSIKTQKQKTLRKNVLKMIREKQQEAYRDLFDKKKAPSSSNTSSKDKTEFDKWKKGLDNLAKDAVKRKTEKTLRIEIDDDAFDQLYGHISAPIHISKSGQRIAIRVISQFGEESTKVLTI